MTESQRKRFPNIFGDSPITKNGRNMVLLKIGRKHPTGHNDTSYVVIGAKMKKKNYVTVYARIPKNGKRYCSPLKMEVLKAV